MAHFIGYIKGSRGEESRTGTKNSGVDARVQGWELGGRVCIEHDTMQERDVVHVYLTRGSNGGRQGDSAFYLGAFALENGELTQVIKPVDEPFPHNRFWGGETVG